MWQEIETSGSENALAALMVRGTSWCDIFGLLWACVCGWFYFGLIFGTWRVSCRVSSWQSFGAFCNESILSEGQSCLRQKKKEDRQQWVSFPSSAGSCSRPFSFWLHGKSGLRLFSPPLWFLSFLSPDCLNTPNFFWFSECYICYDSLLWSWTWRNDDLILEVGFKCLYGLWNESTTTNKLEYRGREWWLTIVIFWTLELASQNCFLRDTCGEYPIPSYL